MPQEAVSAAISITDRPCCARYTYERVAIEGWLRQHGVSPITKKPLPSHSELVPNHTMRSAIHLLIPQQQIVHH